MKKTGSIILSLLLALSLAACGISASAAPIHGTVTGQRYENAALGIGCELPESWSYASEEELAALIGQTAELFDEKQGTKLAELDIFYDMMALGPDGMNSVNVVVQNLGLAGLTATEAQVADASVEAGVQGQEIGGITTVSVERNTVTLGGVEHEGLRMVGEYQGIPVYTQQIVFKSGTHAAAVTLATFLEDGTAELADYFYALK